MILESVVTTTRRNATVNIAPMGPVVDPDLTHFTLKPFRSSATYENLRESHRAVIHITDDVLLIARALMGTLSPIPKMNQLQDGAFHVIKDACRFFAVEVDYWVEDHQRPVAHCRVVEFGDLRPFFGFNRAKHAVIEAAILASRVHLLSTEKIITQMNDLQVLVDKTAGDRERQAFEELKSFIAAAEHSPPHQ